MSRRPGKGLTCGVGGESLSASPSCARMRATARRASRARSESSSRPASACSAQTHSAVKRGAAGLPTGGGGFEGVPVVEVGVAAPYTWATAASHTRSALRSVSVNAAALSSAGSSTSFHTAFRDATAPPLHVVYESMAACELAKCGAIGLRVFIATATGASVSCSC